METNLVQPKQAPPSLSSVISKASSTAFQGVIAHKPEGGCQGCKGCGACGKKAGEGKALDIRV